MSLPVLDKTMQWSAQKSSTQIIPALGISCEIHNWENIIAREYIFVIIFAIVHFLWFEMYFIKLSLFLR